MQTRRPDVLTILSIGLVTWVVVNLVHEGLGHGVTCVLVGGKPIAISSAWWDGSYEGVSEWARRAVRAGGTFANLILGAACVAFFNLRGARLGPSMRYFVWLLAIANLFSGAGYMLADPIGNFGDWSAFIEGLAYPMAWRVGLIAIGVSITRATRIWALRELERFVGGGEDRVSIAWQLCQWPYFVGGAAFTIAGLMNPHGAKFAISSALATFGGKIFVVLLPKWVKPSTSGAPAIALDRSIPWLVAGLISLVVLFGVLAPSISFT